VSLVAVAALGACATLGMGTFKEPIVTFKDMKVRGLGLTGGLRMAGGRRDGRHLVLVSLGLNLAATFLFSAAHLFEAMALIPVLAWLVLAWFTWSSRFGQRVVATPSQVS
jgi:hypothetical protein